MVRSQNPLFPPQTYERRPLPPRIAFSVRPARLSPFLSNCSALFRPPQFANSFAINNLRTLCTKTPGGGTGILPFALQLFRSQPLPYFHWSTHNFNRLIHFRTPSRLSRASRGPQRVRPVGRRFLLANRRHHPPP